MWARLDDLQSDKVNREPARVVDGGKPRRRFRPWWGAVIVAVVVLVGAYMVGSNRMASDSGGRTESVQSVPALATDSLNRSAPAAVSGSGAAPLPAGTAAAGAAVAAPSQARAAGAATGNPVTDATGLNAAGAVQAGETKIIRNGNISIVVKDVPGTVNLIWSAATGLGGYVVTSSTSGAGDDARGEVTLRVPADQYEAAMVRLRGYGDKVLSEKSTAQDVSEEYVDLQARQRNLELTVAQLQALLGQARNVDETLRVQTQLNSVQGDLERVRGRLKFLDNRAAFSTIAVTLATPPAAPKPPVVTPSWSFGTSIAGAWERSLRGLQTFADVLIAIVFGGWWLILLGLIAFFIGRWVLRRRAAPPVASSPVVPPTTPAAPVAD